MKRLITVAVLLTLLLPQTLMAQSLTLSQSLKQGTIAPEVSILQRILNNLGKAVTNIGQETMVFGPRTAAAVKQLQCENGIVCGGPTWGLVGPATRGLLSRLQSESAVLDASTGPGLVAHYAFDGNTNDSVGVYNSTAVGSPTYTTGKVGQAISLNGTTQYAQKDSQVVTGFPFAFSAWAKGRGTIVSTEDKDANIPYYYINLSATAASLVARNNTGNENAISGGVVNATDWNHVVGVFESATSRKLYVNGVLVATGNLSKDFNSALDRLSIGRIGRLSEGGYFIGSIDEVKIFSQSLSSADVASLYSGSGVISNPVTPPANPPANPPAGPAPVATSTPVVPTNPNPVTVPAGILTVKQDGTGNFATVVDCLAVAKAGNTCLVYPGVYTGAVTFANSGTAGNPITLKAAFPWTKGATSNLSVINGNVSVKNYAHVEGLELNGGRVSVNGSNVSVIGNYIHGNESFAPYDGVSVTRVKPYYSNLTVKDNRFYMLSHGMGIFCSDNCLIENNEIERMYTIEKCRLESSGCGADVDAIRIFGNGITLRNNKIFGSKLSEMYENAHVDGIQSFTNGGLGGQGYDTLTNTIIEGNYISDVHQAIWMTTSNCSFNGVPMSNYNLTFRNNILNNGAGFGSARSSIGGLCADNVQVYNNTFLQSTRIMASNKAIIKNNIYDSNAVLDGDKFTWPLKQYEFTNNILTDSGWVNKGTIKIPSIAANNKFVALRSELFDLNNYNLKVGSVAINYGANLSATGFSKDIAGTARPQGIAWDAGAYEWYLGQPVINPPQTQTPSTPTTPTPPVTPTPPADTDSDGVLDTLDRCPATPISLKSIVNAYGCPKPLLINFDIKPDITNLDLNNIPVLELGKTYIGKVTWKQAVALTRTTSQLDLDTHLKIEKNKVTLNSISVPELNKPAQITLYGLTQTNPTIMRDGIICTQPTCTINSYTNGTLIFTVTGFSTYEVVEGFVPPVFVPPTTPTSTPTQGDPTPQPISSGGGGGGGGGVTSGGGSLSGGSSTNIYYGTQAPSTTVTCTPGEIFSSVTGQRCTSNVQDSYSVPVSGYNFTRNLTIGARGDDVKALQDILVSAGHLNLNGEPTTTYFGLMTKSALASYQRANGITPAEGYFGPLTRTRIQGSGGSVQTTYTPPADSSSTFTRNLTIGSRGVDVSALQFVLISQGYLDPSNNTGYFGTATKAALAKLQAAQGISPAEGYFGPLTRSRLGN